MSKLRLFFLSALLLCSSHAFAAPLAADKPTNCKELLAQGPNRDLIRIIEAKREQILRREADINFKKRNLEQMTAKRAAMVEEMQWLENWFLRRVRKIFGMRDEVNRYLVYGYALDELEAFFANGRNTRPIDIDAALLNAIDAYFTKHYDFYVELKDKQKSLSELEKSGEDVKAELEEVKATIQNLICETKKSCLTALELDKQE